MNRRITMRALMVRSRANRNGRAPSETLVRVYDREGNVKSESVKMGNTWVLRSSSISSELLRAPLSSFVAADGASLYDTTQITTQVDHFAGVDASNDSIHITDTTTTNPAALLQSGTIDRSEDQSFSGFEAYYNNVTQLGSVTNGEGGVVLTYVPGEDEFVETDVGYWDYQAAATQFVSDTTAEFAMGLTPGAHSSDSWRDDIDGFQAVNASFIAIPALNSRDCVAQYQNHPQVGLPGAPHFSHASLFMTTDPCVSEKSSLVGASASLVAWGVAGAFCVFFCEPALGFIGRGAATSAAVTVGAAAATIYCVRTNGGAALRGSDPAGIVPESSDRTGERNPLKVRVS